MHSDNLLEVLSEAATVTGSSGTGNTYYSNECGIKAYLDKLYPQLPDFKMRVGIVFHKLMELYYNGKLKDVVLPIDPRADYKHDCIQEAMRVFSGYTQFFPPDEFNVLACELPLGGPDLGSFWGVPFTARLDMVIELKSEQLQKFWNRRGLSLLPGVYILDHKTHTAKLNNPQHDYECSTQFTAYQASFNLCYPKEDLTGVIINDVVRHVDLTKIEEDGLPRSFRSYYISPPSRTRIENVRKYYQQKKSFIDNETPNLNHCRMCPHKNGRCAES